VRTCAAQSGLSANRSDQSCVALARRRDCLISWTFRPYAMN
jgi:hypothetical protein